MSATCADGLTAPVPGRHAGEKDKASDKAENECEIVIDDEIRRMEAIQIAEEIEMNSVLVCVRSRQWVRVWGSEKKRQAVIESVGKSQVAWIQ